MEYLVSIHDKFDVINQLANNALQQKKIEEVTSEALKTLQKLENSFSAKLPARRFEKLKSDIESLNKELLDCDDEQKLKQLEYRSMECLKEFEVLENLVVDSNLESLKDVSLLLNSVSNGFKEVASRFEENSYVSANEEIVKKLSDSKFILKGLNEYGRNRLNYAKFMSKVEDFGKAKEQFLLLKNDALPKCFEELVRGLNLEKDEKPEDHLERLKLAKQAILYLEYDLEEIQKIDQKENFIELFKAIEECEKVITELMKPVLLKVKQSIEKVSSQSDLFLSAIEKIAKK